MTRCTTAGTACHVCIGPGLLGELSLASQLWHAGLPISQQMRALERRHAAVRFTHIAAAWFAQRSGANHAQEALGVAGGLGGRVPGGVGDGDRLGCRCGRSGGSSQQGGGPGDVICALAIEAAGLQAHLPLAWHHTRALAWRARCTRMAQGAIARLTGDCGGLRAHTAYLRQLCGLVGALARAHIGAAVAACSGSILEHLAAGHAWRVWACTGVHGHG